ncbi:HAD-IA family hydrolase [Ochrobactrum sp. BD61]
MAEVLDQIAPSLSADDVLDYWFSRSGYPDERVLHGISILRRQGFSVHCATNQEPLRVDYIWRVHQMDSYFDAVHCSASIGFRKPQRAYYEAVGRELGPKTNDICLIDDTPENVRGAIDCGWAGIHWTGNADIAELVHAFAISEQ